MEYTNRIVTNPDVMLGKPVIKGTRITVEIVLRKLSEGMTIDQLISSYSHLSKDDVYAVLAYASDLIANEEIIIPHASSPLLVLSPTSKH
ncbi:DUF433 domain-containing protein [Ekhidna sp.]